jgi:hypothetical protein
VGCILSPLRGWTLVCGKQLLKLVNRQELHEWGYVAAGEGDIFVMFAANVVQLHYSGVI